MIEPIYLNILLMSIAGAMIGSFLNVLALRLPQALDDYSDDNGSLFFYLISSISYPPSHCPSCESKLKPWMLVPIVSYLLQRGKCTSCDVKISLQYPLIEFISGLLAVYFLITQDTSTAIFGLCLFFAICLVLMIIDFKHHLLLDILTLPLLWLGLIFNLSSTFVSLSSAVMGAIAGYLFLWLIYQIFYLLKGVEGLGYGDFKLFAAIGAWFGLDILPLVLCFGSISALVYFTIGLLLGKIEKTSAIAFGPFLILGTLLCLALPLDWYSKL